jgi:putative membrane protein
MMSLRHALLALALSSALGAGLHPAQAQTTNLPPADRAIPAPRGVAVSAQDRKFVIGAAEAGAAEVAMAQLASDRAASPDVKDFAARMVSDHQKAEDELKSIATARGVAPPGQLSTKDQAALDKLSGMRGAAFDKAYVKAQLSAHKDAVALFKEESTKGKDAELKQFASSTLPTLQDHLQMAQQLARASMQGNTGQGNATTAAKS